MNHHRCDDKLSVDGYTGIDVGWESARLEL